MGPLKAQVERAQTRLGPNFFSDFIPKSIIFAKICRKNELFSKLRNFSKNGVFVAGIHYFVPYIPERFQGVRAPVQKYFRNFRPVQKYFFAIIENFSKIFTIFLHRSPQKPLFIVFYQEIYQKKILRIFLLYFQTDHSENHFLLFFY